MKILVADDDLLCRRPLERTLTRWGYETVAADDAAGAWQALQSKEAPPVAVLDWIMPGNEGLELCRRIRTELADRPIYVILLTANNARQQIYEGLHAGADDYIIKPFDCEELYARLQVGLRTVRLQQALADRVRDLEGALSRVRQLQGLLPICCYCKNIRDDQNYWRQVEEYIGAHSDAQFSHSICPDCYARVVEPQLAAARLRPRASTPSA